MSNRMKIKDKKPKQAKKYYVLTPQALNYLNTYRDILKVKANFVAVIASEQIEKSIIHMMETAKKDNLLGYAKLVKEIDNLYYASKRILLYLRNHHRKCQLTTAPWMVQYGNKYNMDSRVVSNMQLLVGKECGTDFQTLRDIAKRLGDIQESLSNPISSNLLVVLSWARIIENTCASVFDAWAKGGDGSKLDDVSNINNQAKGLLQVCERVDKTLGKFRYDPNNKDWKQYHATEDKIWQEIVNLTNDETFNQKVMEYNTRDWGDFYIGQAMLETQQTGKVPSEVLQELEHISSELAKSVKLMLQMVAKKVEKTEDPYDFIDYLAEHNWKAYKAFHEAVLNKVKDKL